MAEPSSILVAYGGEIAGWLAISVVSLVGVLGTIGWFFFRRVLEKLDQIPENIQKMLNPIYQRLNRHGERISALEAVTGMPRRYRGDDEDDETGE